MGHIQQWCRARFHALRWSPMQALDLFLLRTFDDPEVRVKVATTVFFNVSAFPPTNLFGVADAFRECRAMYNLDRGIGQRVVACLIAHPKLLTLLSIEGILSMQELANDDEQKEELGWAVDCALRLSSTGSAVDRSLPSISAEVAVRLLEAFPTAPRCCQAANTALLRSFQENGSVAPCVALTLALLDVMPRLSIEACPVDLRALVIRKALQEGGLTIRCVQSVVQSFHKMGCSNAVGAMLLKYHPLLDGLPHNAWQVFCEAALAAKLTNPSTRRSLLKRGAELRPMMNLVELELQARCEVSWSDVCAEAWVSVLEVVDRVRQVVADASTAHILTFLCTAIQTSSMRHVVWALCDGVVHHIYKFSADETLMLMRTLAHHRFRHEGVVQRLSTTDSAATHVEVALELFRFCGRFRMQNSDGSVLLSAAVVCVLNNRAMISYKEAVTVMRGMLESNLTHRSLLQAMLDVVTPAIDALDAKELYIVAASIRYHDAEASGNLYQAINIRAVELIGMINVP